jgi:cell division protein FtsB
MLGHFQHMRSQKRKTVVAINLSVILASLMFGTFLFVRSTPRLSQTQQELAAKLDRANSMEKLKEGVVAADAYARGMEEIAARLHMALLVACASGLVVGVSNLLFIRSQGPSHDKTA